MGMTFLRSSLTKMKSVFQILHVLFIGRDIEDRRNRIGQFDRELLHVPRQRNGRVQTTGCYREEENFLDFSFCFLFFNFFYRNWWFFCIFHTVAGVEHFIRPVHGDHQNWFVVRFFADSNADVQVRFAAVGDATKVEIPVEILGVVEHLQVVVVAVAEATETQHERLDESFRSQRQKTTEKKDFKSIEHGKSSQNTMCCDDKDEEKSQ